MNADLGKLLELQKMDLALTEIAKSLESIPREISALREEIAASNLKLETHKKSYTDLQLRKKNLEIETATFEEKIRKNEKELNSVKSNDTYKALLTEIETAKAGKGKIEDEILEIMMRSDELAKQSKSFEQEIKKEIDSFNAQIRAKEQEAEAVKAEELTQQAAREQFLPQVPAEALSRYEFIRTRKKTFAIARIVGETCGGCNTTLPPSTILMNAKSREILYCENCSRILYSEEKPAEEAPSTDPAATQ